MRHVLAWGRCVNGNSAPSPPPKRPEKTGNHRRRLGQFERLLDIDVDPSGSKHLHRINFTLALRIDGDDRIGLPLPSPGDGFDTRISRPFGWSPDRDPRQNFNSDGAGLILSSDELSRPGSAAVVDRPRLAQGVGEYAGFVITAEEEDRFAAARALCWPCNRVAPSPVRRTHGPAPPGFW